LTDNKNSVSKKISRRKFLAVAGGAVAVGAVGGYWLLTNNQQQSAQLGDRKAKWDAWASTLYIGTTSFQFHPGIDIGSSSADSIYRHMIAPRIFWVDGQTSGQYNPLVGASWKQLVDSDNQTYIEFKFQANWKFRDGTPINAQNLKWNWERALNDLPNRKQNNDSYAVYAMQESWGTSQKKLVVVDDLTLDMYVNPDFPNFQPFWKHFLFALDYSFMFSMTMGQKYGGETNSLDDYVLIGKNGAFGPFYLSDWVPNQRLVLAADPNYPVNPLGGMGGPTRSENIKTIVVTGYQDTASLRMALQSGEIDSTMQGEIGRPDVPSLQQDPNIHMEIIPNVGTGNQLHMNWDPQFTPLDKIPVRQAIQYAVDPSEIVSKLMFGTATVSDSPVRPFLQYYKAVMKPIRDMSMTDRITKAKQLLSDAGFPNGFGTQFWYASGVATESFNRDLGTILQAQLAKIGVTLDLKYVETGTYTANVKLGVLPMFCRGWTMDYPDPDTELFYLMYSTSPDLAMRIKFNDPAVDALLMEGRNIYGVAGKESRRQDIYTQLQDYIVSHGFDVPLYLDGFWYGSGAYIQNYKPWTTCDKPFQGLWNIAKQIPTDWQTHDPPH
jgi:ABC-type transport system substrate-binding protein